MSLKRKYTKKSETLPNDNLALMGLNRAIEMAVGLLDEHDNACDGIAGNRKLTANGIASIGTFLQRASESFLTQEKIESGEIVSGQDHLHNLTSDVADLMRKIQQNTVTARPIKSL